MGSGRLDLSANWTVVAFKISLKIIVKAKPDSTVLLFLETHTAPQQNTQPFSNYSVSSLSITLVSVIKKIN